MLTGLQRNPFAVCSRRLALILLLAACAALAGCAMEVVRTPTRFSPPGADRRPDIVLTREVAVLPASGLGRTLKAGSTWRHVGEITEGAVFKIQNDVFMVEGAHMHEAYCVLDRGDRLVGFYLPVENGFVAVVPAMPLPISK